MIIRISYRNNLLFPIFLLVFTTLRGIVEIIITENNNELPPFLLPLLIFVGQFIAGFSSHLYSIYKNKSNNKDKPKRHRLIKNHTIQLKDSNTKIIFLVLLASFFSFIGTVVRKFKINEELYAKTLEGRIKSFQIIVSGILCYITIRIEIYKHQIFTLIIISICLITIIIFEYIYKDKHPLEESLELSIFFSFFSGFGKAFLDTIEKYLIEFDYQSPFKLLIYEGFINFFLVLILFFSTHSNPKGNDNKSIVLLIILLILYFILTGLKNIYRIMTIKLYSPMTRAMTECVLSPAIYLYILWNYYKIDIKVIELTHFIVNIICLLIMSICTLIYNDFIVLYCFGLEYNTYREIAERSDNNSNDSINDSKEEIDQD